MLIGVVVGAVVLIGGGVAAFFLLKNDKKDDTQLAAAKGNPNTPAETGPPWVEYTDAEAKFRVKFPAQPQVETEQAGPVAFKVAVLQRGPANFAAGAEPVPPEKQGDPDRVLDKEIEGATGKLPGGVSITDKKPITHQGKPGRELIMSGQGLTGVIRIFYANERIYSLSVIGENVTPTTPIVKPFFDSLQID